MTDRRVKEYIIGKDTVAEFVKTVQEWKFQKDWEKKGLIFNPETGISEDGTMHDGVYRPWINQPKKEQEMTREEAIYILRNLKAMAIRDKYIMQNSRWAFDLEKIMDLLQEPITLADFLGWEEGQEYEWRGDIFRIQSDILQVYDKEDESWYDSAEELNDYLRLRQAKKVKEPKPKAWRVRDEYSYNCLIKELEEQGYTKAPHSEGYSQVFPIIYINCDGEYNEAQLGSQRAEMSDIIEYHKEEPKYKWRFKSVKTIRIDGKVLYFHHAEDCDLILDSYPNVRYMTENLLRAELRDTRFGVDDFERVE